METLTERFKQALQRRLDSKELTKAELCRRLGMKNNALIDRYLSGETGPTLRIAERIANAFGMGLFQFVGEEPESVKEPLEECYRRIGDRLFSGPLDPKKYAALQLLALSSDDRDEVIAEMKTLGKKKPGA